mgnify:CR=1 FL=1
MESYKIGSERIGFGQPTYIIAEIGFNHEGDIHLAIKMIEAAAEAGANAVKFQSYQAANLVLKTMEHYDLIKAGEMNTEDHGRLMKAAHQNGVAFLSTPYSVESMEMLDKMGVPAFKVASMDLTNLPFLRSIAQKDKPMIISTGLAILKEVADAVDIVNKAGNNQIVLLHCISKYPAVAEDANLRTIPMMCDAFDLPVGFSDHMLGNAVSLAAVSLGACAVEKHFTIDKNLPGPDHKISADKEELTQLVNSIREVEKSLGKPCLNEERPDRQWAKAFRRGVFAAVDIPAGTVITAEMLKSVRPETGVSPVFFDWIVGRTARVSISKETPITVEKI